MARDAVGMSGAMMLREVGDLAQSVGGKMVCVDGENVKQYRYNKGAITAHLYQYSSSL